MKRTNAILLIAAFSLLFILPVALPSGMVSAQSSGYSIDKVDHQINVLYSGNIAVVDTIHVSGRVADGFMIGLPLKYSASVVEGLAYDENHLFQMNLGVQLGDQIGFYGAEVNFNGNSPSVFTVGFVLSNRVFTEHGQGNFTLDYPAYPSLTQNAGSCDVNLIFPGSPANLTISKTDGATTETSYGKSNLPAYTYSIGTANFQMPTGTLQLVTVNTLNRQVTVDATGAVTSTDSFTITNNSPINLGSFTIGLPVDAKKVVVKDDVGRSLSTSYTTPEDGSEFMANATLSTFLAGNQSTVLKATYNLPSATIKGANYVLENLNLFPDFKYFINQLTFTFTPPEGATIVSPQASSLDSSSTLNRQSFQDTLTITRNGISYLDYNAPQEQNALQLSYEYNPIWTSFRPTFWAALLAIIGCFGLIFVRRRKSKATEPYVSTTERVPAQKTIATGASAQIREADLKTGQHITAETMKDFIDAYEDKKQLTAEIKALDARAQKGKIPRRQYKVQRSAIEFRLEGIEKHLEKTKVMFRSSTGTYADLVRQLDDAEADLGEAEENIRNLEARQSKGEVSMEVYKKNIGDYQKHRDKAESAISGILLRLREKTR
jgi:hypothetical protein